MTSRNYARPRRPAALHLLNLRRPPPLDARALLAAAERHTGLSDFGDPFFREPFEVLIDSINREARLHATGRAIMATRIAGLLENRLRVEEAWPTVAAQPIRRTVRRTRRPCDL